MYKQVNLSFGQTEPSCIIRISDGACIPFAEGNTDYQAYLLWISEGNTPLPADEQGATQ
jgi:hypothetical protein